MNETITATPKQSPTLKLRHGCLTAYLVFMIIANSATALVYLVGSEDIRQGITANKSAARHQLPFDQIKSGYERAKARGSVHAQGSLADFAKKMQTYDPEHDWSQGQLPDNWTGSVSRKIGNWAFPLLVVGGFFNIVCAIALFRWKKWGFWGFVGSASIICVVNLSIGLGIGSALVGLIGVVILAGVLYIGKERKAWPQLE